jgi:CBS domain-containing protein
MFCRDVMKTEVHSCHETDSVAAGARIMRDHNIGFLPVLDDDGMVSGILTDRDLAVRVLANGLPGDTPVTTVMTRDVRVCLAYDDLRTAEERMADVRKSRLVVIHGDGSCAGVISLSDIARAESPSRAGQLLYEVTQRKTSEPVFP